MKAIGENLMTEPALDHLDYGIIPDIHDAYPAVAAQMPALSMIGSILRRHDVSSDICPFLLHRHFHIGPEEVLVRHYVDGRFIVQPSPPKLDDPVCAYALEQDEEGALRPRPFEYLDRASAPSDALGQCKALSSSIATLSSDMSDLPRSASRTFGLMIVHPAPDPGGARFWIEESTEKPRRSITQSVTAEAIGDAGPNDLIQTAWIFSDGRDPVTSRICCGPRYRLNCIEV